MHTFLKNTLTNYTNLEFPGLIQLHTMEHHLDQDGTHIATFTLEVTPELSEDALDNALGALSEGYQGIQDVILEKLQHSDLQYIPNGSPNNPGTLIYAPDATITVTRTDLSLVITLVTFEP